MNGETVDQSAAVLVLARTLRGRREYVGRGSPSWSLSVTWSLGHAWGWETRCDFDRWLRGLQCWAVLALAREGWELVEVALGEAGPAGDGRPVSPGEAARAAEEIRKHEEEEAARKARRKPDPAVAPTMLDDAATEAR